MIAIGLLFVRALCDCFKPRQRLQAEILVLQHQLNVLRQRAPRRLHLRWADREHRVLAGPLGRSIAEASDADGARQSSFDGSLHEVGREERESFRDKASARSLSSYSSYR